MKLMSRRWVAALAAVPLLLLSLVTLQSSTVLASGNPDFKLVWWPSSTATNAGSDLYTDGWSSTSGSSPDAAPGATLTFNADVFNCGATAADQTLPTIYLIIPGSSQGTYTAQTTEWAGGSYTSEEAAANFTVTLPSGNYTYVYAEGFGGPCLDSGSSGIDYTFVDNGYDTVPVDGGPPAQPAYVDASNNASDQVSFSWPAVASGGQYQPWPTPIYNYRYINDSTGVTSGGYYNGEFTSATLSLTPGDYYTMEVEAANYLGTSSWTASNEVLVEGVPSAPGTLTATVNTSNGTIGLSWSAPSNTGGGSLTYTVTPSPSCSTCTGLTTGGTGTTVGGLTGGTTYQFYVTASNAMGSASSGWSSAVEDLGPPAAPTGLTGSAQSDGTVHLSWMAPSNNGGAAITGYTVTSNPACSTCTGLSTGGSTTSTSIGGLTLGTAYTFTVKATNTYGAGTGVASSPITAAMPPDAPTIGTATAATDGSVTVTWTDPANNGSAITQYSITPSPACSSCTGLAVSGAAATSGRITGLAYGASYTFTVSASNAMGTGPASGASNSAVPNAAPNAPSALYAGNDPDGSVTLTWTAPSDNGSTITGYTVTPSPACSSCAGLSVSGNPTSPSTVIAGLTQGTSYTFTVTATNSIGNSNPSSASNSVTAASVPDAPVIVSQTANTDGTVGLTWLAPADNGAAITSYIVTPDPACSSCSGLTSAGTSATIGGLTYGNSYTFTVSATNVAGMGPSSASSPAVVPATVPAAPTGVTATDQADGSISVSWTAPSDNGASITGYTVSVSPACTGCTGFTATGTWTNVAGLSVGTAYTFTVTATNVQGTGSASIASNSVLAAAVPDAPTGVSGTANTDGSVDLSWTAPAGNGAIITGYTVTPNPACSACTGLTVSGSPAAAAAHITGFQLGTTYTFTVTATNAAGSSPASTGSNTLTPTAPPGSISSPTPTLNPDGTMTLTWTAPADNGLPITGYIVTASPACSACTGLTVAGTPPPTTTTITGLTPGVAYTFTVTAANADGSGSAGSGGGSGSTAITDALAPAAPTGVTAAADTDGSVSLSWTAPNDNDATITTYTVHPEPACAGCSGLTVTGNPASAAATVTGFSLGTGYTFTVTATNDAGTSAASSPSVQVVPASPPGTPTGVVATDDADGSIGLDWVAPSDNGATITAFTVSVSPACFACTGLATTGNPAGIATIIRGLTLGAAYTFTVEATNGQGTGPWSQASASVVAVAEPDAPTGLRATANPTDGSVNLSWTAPAGNGAAVTGYVVVPNPACTGCSGLTPSGTTAHLTGLILGAAYTFTVRATNVAGTGPASAPTASVTPTQPPGAVSPPSAALQPDGSVTLTWTPPEDGGLPIGGYIVTPSPACPDCTGLTVTGNPPPTTTTITGLTPGVAYTFTITAVNADGSGSSGLPGPVGPSGSTSVTDALAPDAPAGVTATAKPDGSVVVTWTAPADNHAAITGYLLITTPVCPGCAGLTVQGDPAATTTRVMGLTLGTAYTVQVNATNAAGTGPISSPSGSIIPATAPSRPSAPSAHLTGSGTAAISWPAATANGAAVTRYTLTVSPSCASCTGLMVIGDPAASSTTVGGLREGTAYTFTLAATNRAGTSPASAQSPPLVDAGVPNAVSGVTAVGGNGQVTVSWTAPADNGAPITSYRVTASPGGGACTWSGGPLRCAISGLANGTAYTVAVTAANVAGSSPATTASTALPVTPNLPALHLTLSPLALSNPLSGPITVSGAGLKPGSTLTITLHSMPLTLAQVTVAQNGEVSQSVTIPHDTIPGPHHLIARGARADGTLISATLALTVPGGGAAAGGTASGFALPLAIGLALAVLIGLVGLVALRPGRGRAVLGGR